MPKTVLILCNQLLQLSPQITLQIWNIFNKFYRRWYTFLLWNPPKALKPDLWNFKKDCPLTEVHLQLQNNSLRSICLPFCYTWNSFHKFYKRLPILSIFSNFSKHRTAFYIDPNILNHSQIKACALQPSHFRLRYSFKQSRVFKVYMALSS